MGIYRLCNSGGFEMLWCKYLWVGTSPCGGFVGPPPRQFRNIKCSRSDFRPHSISNPPELQIYPCYDHCGSMIHLFPYMLTKILLLSCCAYTLFLCFPLLIFDLLCLFITAIMERTYFTYQKKTNLEKFQIFVYDPSKNSFCGRTCKSWGKSKEIWGL